MFGSILKDGFASIMLSLDSIVYRIVGWLYQVFIAIASARIFTSETFDAFESRIYSILGIVMLFIVAYSLLQAITDPDKITDGGFSGYKIMINVVVGLVLIAVMPTLFDVAYKAQEILLEQNIVGKIILGSYSTASSTLDVTYDNQEDESIDAEAVCELFEETAPCTVRFSSSNSNSLELAGNSIAVDVFSSFFYPTISGDGDSASEDDTSESSILLASFSYDDVDPSSNKKKSVFIDVSNYNKCTGDSDTSYIYGEGAEICALANSTANNTDAKDRSIYYRSVLQYAKTTGDFSAFTMLNKLIDDDKMSYTWVISTVAGGFCVYIFVSYCLDLGLRAAKLGFAQLVAPIPILARIVPGQDKMFNSWLSFTLKTFADVFIKIAIIFFGIFMVTNLPDLNSMWSSSILTNIASLSTFKFPVILDLNASYGVMAFAKVIVIIGILMFMKQAPTLLQEALGINLNGGSLNIRNKLRNMVGGETLSKAGSFAAGAVTGGIGAGYMAKRNGGSFWRSAVKGGREGAAAGGWQLGKQGQAAYHATTGDKYNGSFITGNRSITGRIDAGLDNSARTLERQNKERLQKIIDNDERDETGAYKQSFINEVNTKRVENETHLATVRSSQQYVTATSTAANNYKRQQQSEMDQRKTYVENTREYNNAKHVATAIAQQKPGFKNMSAAEQDAEIKKNIYQQLQNSTDANIQQYLKDANRNLNEEVKKVADEEYAKNNKDFAKRLSKTEEDFMNEVRAEHDKKDQKLGNARKELKRQGELEEDKVWRRNFEYYQKQNNGNKKP